MVYFSEHGACLCVRDAEILGTSLKTLFQRQSNVFGWLQRLRLAGPEIENKRYLAEIIGSEC